MINALTNTASYNKSFGTTAQTAASEQKDQFLRLLTYQLQNQNPLSPYDNQEFASQLAQFSQLEQLSDIKSLIEEQNTYNHNLGQIFTNSALPGMLGKSASVQSDRLSFDGDKPSEISYELPETCTSGELVIRNSAGMAVRKIAMTGLDLTSGSHKMIWDGKDDDGNTLDKGNYSIKIITEGGSQVPVATYVKGLIESIKFKNEGTMLVIGGVETSLDKIKLISN